MDVYDENVLNRIDALYDAWIADLRRQVDDYRAAIDRLQRQLDAERAECRTLWRAVGEATAGVAGAAARFTSLHGIVDANSPEEGAAEGGSDAARSCLERLDVLLGGLVPLTLAK